MPGWITSRVAGREAASGGETFCSALSCGVAAFVLLICASAAPAAQPKSDRGAEMLRSLRERDPAASWAATAPASTPPAAFTPSAATTAPNVSTAQNPSRLPPSPPSLPSPPALPTPSAGPQWRTAQRSSAATAAPGRIAFQSEDPVPTPVADDPFAPAEPYPAADPPGGLDTDPYVKPIPRTPDQLRKISDIQPFWDYEPDQNIDDPCLYLCPRPDGLPCKQYGPDERTPVCPEEVTLSEDPFSPRLIPPSVYAWKASNIHYNPLYFEDVALERYGHNYGFFQPAVSLGKYSFQLIGLPYQIGLDHPCKCVYPLGYYRPGEPAPKLFYQVPLNAKAAAVSVGFYSGIGVVLP